MYKIDLHTHSIASPDGSISQEEYGRILESEALHAVAITDHDQVDFALRMRDILGEKIIVGQEITTRDGEIIGLFLQERVTPGLSAKETAVAIHTQGGLVYIPHPFETVRKGISQVTLDSIIDEVDIVEAYNGRALLQNRGPQATTWARMHQKPIVSSSDAHGLKGLGATYTLIKKRPSRDNLLKQLAQAQHAMQRPPLYSLLYPKANRLVRKFKRTSRYA